MATIRIQNFGPIKDTGLIDLTQIMLVIGRQSSGKSTFMKILSQCRWLEKTLMARPLSVAKKFCEKQHLVADLKQFHRINELYFQDDTLIEYVGDVVNICVKGRGQETFLVCKEDCWKSRYNTKLSYIPAERNLVSAIRNINSVYKTDDRDTLFNFILEWNECRRNFTSDSQLRLSLTENFQYYDEVGQDFVVLPNGKNITSFYASSGVQSVIPIDVISEYVTSSVGKVVKYSVDDLMSRMMEMLGHKVGSQDATAKLDEKMDEMREFMIYKSAQLFIEEPEQNLYPDAQRVLVQNLVRRIKKAQSIGDKESILMMTTHSPYVLSTLNALMADAFAMQQKPKNMRLKEVVDTSTLLPLSAYSAYYINNEGMFENIKDMEIPMFSGIDLDSVSDWVDEHVAQINDILYAE